MDMQKIVAAFLQLFAAFLYLMDVSIMFCVVWVLSLGATIIYTEMKYS